MPSSGCDPPALTLGEALGLQPERDGPLAGHLRRVGAGHAGWRPCLVSCAIDWFAEVTVTLNGAGGRQIPPGATKSAAALRLALAARDVPAAWAERSGCPTRSRAAAATRRARPMSPGTIYAAGAALGRPFTAGEAARLAVQVEPSDSTIFPGPTLFAHRDGSFHRPLAPLPPLAVVILDPGGAVDTLAFNAADHTAALRRLAPIHREAFGRFEAGLAAGDPVEAAQAATLSATAHQAILPSALVEAALGVACGFGRAGHLPGAQRHAGWADLPAGGSRRGRPAHSGALPRRRRADAALRGLRPCPLWPARRATPPGTVRDRPEQIFKLWPVSDRATMSTTRHTLSEKRPARVQSLFTRSEDELATTGGDHPAPGRGEHGRGAGPAGLPDQAPGQPGPAGGALDPTGRHHGPAAAQRERARRSS